MINHVRRLGPVRLGGSNPVRIMGILNQSPESFYKKSVRTAGRAMADAVQKMEQQGADIIDIGGMSTAPYLPTMVTEREESARITRAIGIVQRATNLPISVDTCRSGVAEDALKLGAEIINDVTGLKYDAAMLRVIERHSPSVVLCAHKRRAALGDARETARLLRESVRLARSAGVSEHRMALDPAIGFFRRTGRGRLFSRTDSDWASRDLSVLQNLGSATRGFPALVSVSRKSFIGAVLGAPDPEDRLAGSLACEMFSILCGADVIRTHNVGESKHIAGVARAARA